MRKLITFLLVLILVAAAWAGWTLFWPVQPPLPKYVLLRPGWSVRHIAAELRAQGVIRSEPAFLLWHYVVKPKSLKAGEYKFDQRASALQVHERIVRGDIYKHVVVVPEGFNIFEIASSMEAAGLGTRDEFLKVARENVSLISDLDPQAQSLEGYLFPDTYQFTRTQSMGDMVAAMVRRFRQEAQGLGLKDNAHQVVTLASIIEKETALDEERPMVASVYQNRLEQKIALAADPSVIYAALLAGRYTGAIHQSDLQFDSPYNTYRNPGLPPGPIANPGRDSLRAAMHPAQTDFLYFVSDGNGHHRFAKTLDEHTRNVAAYRRALSSAQ